MPCIVPRCEGVWHYRIGSKVAPCSDGEQPVERMCDRHRVEHGAAPRNEANKTPNPVAHDENPVGSSTADDSDAKELETGAVEADAGEAETVAVEVTADHSAPSQNADASIASKS